MKMSRRTPRGARELRRIELRWGSMERERARNWFHRTPSPSRKKEGHMIRHWGILGGGGNRYIPDTLGPVVDGAWLQKDRSKRVIHSLVHDHMSQHGMSWPLSFGLP